MSELDRRAILEAAMEQAEEGCFKRTIGFQFWSNVFA